MTAPMMAGIVHGSYGAAVLLRVDSVRCTWKATRCLAAEQLMNNYV